MFSKTANWELFANHCKIVSGISFRCLFANGVFDSEMDTTMDTVRENLRKMREPQQRSGELFHSVTTILLLSVYVLSNLQTCTVHTHSLLPCTYNNYVIDRLCVVERLFIGHRATHSFELFPATNFSSDYMCKLWRLCVLVTKRRWLRVTYLKMQSSIHTRASTLKGCTN